VPSVNSAYHHGDLRRAVLDAAVDAIAEAGPATLSLRDLARRANVSHAAPAYHFVDKAGLLTALATEGFGTLADSLLEAERRTGQFLEVGVAYVRFAVDHQSYFEVMFRPDLYNADDPELRVARERARHALIFGAGGAENRATDLSAANVAAWSLVHGFASLWLNGSLPPEFSGDPDDAARAVAGLLFRS
jgi:AcrR family transcriptional regulator